MERLDKIIKSDAKGQIVYDGWIEYNHKMLGYSHCEECTKLEGCWFHSLNSPKIPHHPNCHCYAKPIDTPTINQIKAECDIRKFTGYIFAEKGLVNGKRAIFDMLGFTIGDSEYLKNEYERQARQAYYDGKYRLGLRNDKGQRITIDIILSKNGHQYAQGSGWMVDIKGKIRNTTPVAQTDKDLIRRYKNEKK